MRGLKDKRILIAGGATGIGAATAKRLASEGVAVVIGDINIEGAESVVRSIEDNGGKAYAFKFDLADETSIRSLIDFTIEKLGGLDGIANIGADVSDATAGNDIEVLEMQLPIWEKTLNTNLIGYALVIKYGLPHLKNAGGGYIVNTTSAAFHIGEKVRPAYAASKAGVNTLTRHIASTYGKDDVRCNCVSPGAVLTETGLSKLSEDFQAQILAGTPLNRLGKPEDLANTIAFLLSDEAEWITGQVWSINGGAGYRE
ncbi:NAD(P)-dependent dehydrogenase, short-chain alcohol dehydrogenase family [Paenimyroides ummariense]|uniref:NAD(P)-dependent dehydrogenase, short-chain alcohol dehydrogenase family n=1 Tax=Paenimyroides ummariense TaxID=913024 RepID=A0A1I5CTG5_9FLAO|nr:SDR family NAD(P)-dependent oxidoreductase [Paenimyroides ummariense]SFN90233.1 NAD(P)-dependent dehydrogenase, short-chain alcohol dehydrogenase family [Paenimyroides ummariense]